MVSVACVKVMRNVYGITTENSESSVSTWKAVVHMGG
jgi:hypothetical protein